MQQEPSTKWSQKTNKQKTTTPPPKKEGPQKIKKRVTENKKNATQKERYTNN